MLAKITRVETIPLHIPFHTPVKIASGGARPFVETLLVRLHTQDGMSGVGETQAWRRQGSSDTLPGLVRVIEDHCAPTVLGKSPFEIAAIAHAMDETIYHSYYAKAAVLDALYDLQGKLLGVPVHQLLGGKCRSEVEACAVLTMKPKVEDTLAGAEQYVARGFKSLTVKVGNDSDADYANIAAIREKLGDGVRIRIDANASMGFDSALALLRRIERFGIDCAEQLLPLWDVDGMTDLARRVDIPMMADEAVATDHDLMKVIKARAASIAQTKVAKNGGIWHSRKLWHVADAAGLRIYPGNHPSTSVATLSVIHLSAAWAGDLMDGPFAVGVSGVLAEDIVEEPVKFRGNALSVPDLPGLGFTLDEAKIRHLRADV